MPQTSGTSGKNGKWCAVQAMPFFCLCKGVCVCVSSCGVKGLQGQHVWKGIRFLLCRQRSMRGHLEGSGNGFSVDLFLPLPAQVL